MNYLIKYESFILFDKWLKDLKKKYNEEEISNYNLTENTLSEALEDLCTYSLFSNKKLIIIDSIMSLSDTDKDYKAFIKYLENPNKDYTLVMTDSKLTSIKKTIKEIKKNSKYIELKESPIDFLSNKLKDYKISMIDKNLILEYTDNDIDSIENECNKLYEYKEKGSTITKEDIESVCYKRLYNYTPLAFDITSYIAKKDSYNAMKTYLEFKKYNIDDAALTGLIESELRSLKIISKMKNSGFKDSDIASNSHISKPPFNEKKIYVMEKLLRYVSEKEINDLIHQFYNLDLSIKNGTNISENPLELFILNIK